MESNSNGNIFHVVSWVCLLIGWLFGFGIIIFPVGMATATNAQNNGHDAGLVRSLNKWSFAIHLFLFLIGILFVMLLA